MGGFGWVILVALVIGAIWYFGKKDDGDSSTLKGSVTARPPGPATPPRRPVDTAPGKRTEVVNRMPPIPSGFQIYAARVSVAGLKHRKEDGQRYIRSTGQSLAFEPEPTNSYDPTAIKVIGTSDSGPCFLGYVPAEIAEQIVGSGLTEAVQPRLEYAAESANGYVDIIFQVLGPKAKKDQFREFLNTKPALFEQKEFLSFFGMPVPRGMTVGQATAAIEAHQAKLTAEGSSKLADFAAYESVCDEVDDQDFGENYGVKKISRPMLREALAALTLERVTIQDVEGDIALLVDKIIELNPAMKRANA